MLFLVDHSVIAFQFENNNFLKLTYRIYFEEKRKIQYLRVFWPFKQPALKNERFGNRFLPFVLSWTYGIYFHHEWVNNGYAFHDLR